MATPQIAASEVKTLDVKSIVPEPKVAELDDKQRADIGVKKATCPFIGTKVKQGALKVYFAPDDKEKKHPLAKISDVVTLGNSGGGTLGYALGFFAKANQSIIPGVGQCPDGYFSLEFGGSKGAHFGDSGFVRNGPTGDGAFGSAKWNDFVKNDKFVTNGKTSIVQLGKFIASNVAQDPRADAGFSNVFAAAKKTLGDLHALAHSAKNMDNMTGAQKQKLVEDFGRVLGSNNLIGSAGEFALQTTLLRNTPGTSGPKSLNAKFSVKEMGDMFQMAGFPDGEGKPKSALRWMQDSIEIGTVALASYAAHHAKAKLAAKLGQVPVNLTKLSGDLEKQSGAMIEEAGWTNRK